MKVYQRPKTSTGSGCRDSVTTGTSTGGIGSGGGAVKDKGGDIKENSGAIKARRQLTQSAKGCRKLVK